MNSKPHGEFLHLAGSTQTVGSCTGFVVGGDCIRQIPVDPSDAAFHKGRRQIADDRGIAAAFGCHGLPYIGSGVEIEVGSRAHKTVGPVFGTQSHLLAWGELKRSVGSEMDQGIRTEAVSRPKIGGHVVVWRSGICAVHYLEIIVAESCGRLRNKHDVSQPDSRQGYVASIVAESVAGKGAVGLHDLLAHFCRQSVGTPSVVIFPAYDLRGTLFYEIAFGTGSIAVEYLPLAFDHLSQLIGRRRKIADIVTFGPEAGQHIVKGGNHIHSLGYE